MSKAFLDGNMQSGSSCAEGFINFENIGDTWYILLSSALLILRWNLALRVNIIQFW
jgi:hypothetical protein